MSVPAPTRSKAIEEVLASAMVTAIPAFAATVAAYFPAIEFFKSHTRAGWANLALGTIPAIFGVMTGEGLKVALRETNSRAISIIGSFAGSSFFAFTAGTLFEEILQTGSSSSFVVKSAVAIGTGVVAALASYMVPKDKTAHSIAAVSLSLGATSLYAEGSSRILLHYMPEMQGYTAPARIASWVGAGGGLLLFEGLIKQNFEEQGQMGAEVGQEAV